MGVAAAIIGSALVAAGASAYSSHKQSQAAKAQARAQEEAARKQAQAQEEQARAEREAAEKQAQAAKEAAANTPQDRQEAMSAALRQDEQNKLRRRRGLTGTIMTSPLGTTGNVETGGNKLGVM